MKKQITVVATRIAYTSRSFAVEFYSSEDCRWLSELARIENELSPRQAAIKASASVGGAAPNAEFYYNNETGEEFTRKVDERNPLPGGCLLYSSCKSKPIEIHKFFSADGSYCSIDKLGYEVGRVEQQEQANHIYDTPEYRALERRFEEEREQKRVALCNAETALNQRDEYKKLWEQAGEVIGKQSNELYAARAELENAKTIISNLRLRNETLEGTVKRQAEALHETSIAVAPVRHGQAVYCCDGAANNLIKELTKNLEEAREENRKLQQRNDNQYEMLKGIREIIKAEPVS